MVSLAIRADGSSQVSGIRKIGPWPRSADNARAACHRGPFLLGPRSQKTVPEFQSANSVPAVAFIDNIIQLLLP